jgi:photosystem II stability/assembly factor-like uncharacterized protein
MVIVNAGTFSVGSSFTENSFPTFVSPITFGGNEWVWNRVGSTSERFVQFTPGGTRVSTGDEMGPSSGFDHIRAGTLPILIKLQGVGGSLVRYADNGRTFQSINLAPETMSIAGYDITPDGQWLMGDWTEAAKKGRSADGGYSWSALPALPFGGAYEYSYCGGGGALSKWIAAKGAIWFTENFGNSWVQKTGNLLDLCPPPDGATIMKIVSFLETES